MQFNLLLRNELLKVEIDRLSVELSREKQQADFYRARARYLERLARNAKIRI